MNSSNILGEVLKFATTSIPDKCEMCTRIFGNMPSPPLLLKTVENNGLVKNQYLCKYCWCECLDSSSSNFSRHIKVSEIKASIRTLANPEWDETKKKSFVSREWLSIRRGEILFQKHRVTKTQAKADFYEKEIYNYLRREFTKEKANYKARQEMLKGIELRQKKWFCERNSREWTKEIKLRKITKWFSDRKIPYKLYTHLVYELSRCSLCVPTWEQLGDEYTLKYCLSLSLHQESVCIKRTQWRCTLPEWFNEL